MGQEYGKSIFWEGTMSPQGLQTTAAIASAIAAMFSVIATLWGPLWAANLSEKLRARSEQEHARLSSKRAVFNILMQERAKIGSREANRALNLAVVAFSDSKTVRDKLGAFYRGIHTGMLTGHKANEALIDLLKSMAVEVRLPSELTADEISNVFGSTEL